MNRTPNQQTQQSHTQNTADRDKTAHNNKASHGETAKITKRRNVTAILLVASLSFLGILTETSLNVSFPVLSREFGVPLNMVQWLTSGYLLMIAIIMIASSFLNRRFTARALFRFGAIAFLVGSLICILSTNFPVLLTGRLLTAFRRRTDDPAHVQSRHRTHARLTTRVLDGRRRTGRRPRSLARTDIRRSRRKTVGLAHGFLDRRHPVRNYLDRRLEIRRQISQYRTSAV